MDKEIDLQLVLERFPPGDRWVPKGKDAPIFSSLTEGIEWVFQNTQARDYLVKFFPCCVLQQIPIRHVKYSEKDLTDLDNKTIN